MTSDWQKITIQREDFNKIAGFGAITALKAASHWRFGAQNRQISSRSNGSDEAAPTASAPSAAVVQAEEPQVLTSADRAARLRRLDQRHDDAPGA